MKRIEFIAPVESMRGNLSGAQKLEYPTDNLGAYEGPMGSVNYARNYSPRFVGAKIAKSGRKYFAVRLRTANHLTAKSKKAMALLGGTGAVYAAILKEPTLLAGIQAQYAALTEIGMQKSFRKYVTDVIRFGLASHADLFTFAGPATLVQVDNPWVTSAETPNVSVSQRVLIKFWTELSVDGITFNVEEQTGIATLNDSFNDVIGAPHNVLGLSTEDVKGTIYVKKGSKWLLNAEGAHVIDGDTVAPSGAYVLSSVAPA